MSGIKKNLGPLLLQQNKLICVYTHVTTKTERDREGERQIDNGLTRPRCLDNNSAVSQAPTATADVDVIAHQYPYLCQYYMSFTFVLICVINV